MISRISTFSGPKSILFKVSNTIAGFTTDNLKLAYSPDNGNSSTWYDIKGTNNATLTGSPTYSSIGYTFNGTSQYGRIDSVSGVTDFTSSDNYTIELWINPSTGQPNSGEAEIFEKWNQFDQSRYPYTIRYNENAGSILAACFDGNNFPNVSVSGFPTNTWKQVVVVFSHTTDVLSIYRNGVLGGTVSLAIVNGNNISNTSKVGIAHRVAVGGVGAQVMFKGSVGIIRMYSSALSASDVSKNFEANRSIYGI
jgi:hypothetical protein